MGFDLEFNDQVEMSKVFESFVDLVQMDYENVQSKGKGKSKDKEKVKAKAKTKVKVQTQTTLKLI